MKPFIPLGGLLAVVLPFGSGLAWAATPATPPPAPTDKAASALESKGNDAYNAGRYAEAERDYRQAMRLSPTNGDYVEDLADALRSEDKLDDAMTAANAALAIDPKASAYLVARARVWAAKGDKDKTHADFAAAIAANPKDSAPFFYRSLWEQEDLNDDKAALVDVNQALSLQPGDVQALAERGDVYADLARYDEALADYLAALKSDPRNYVALRGRAWIYGKREDWAVAAVYYDAMIEVYPQDADMLGRRGKVWDKLADQVRAKADFDMAVRLDPKDDSHLTDRGEWEDSHRQYDAAIADDLAATRLKAGDLDAWSDLSQAYHDKGDDHRALDAATQGLKIAPEDGSLLVGHGLANWGLGNYNEARADYDHQLRNDPKDAVALYDRALALVQLDHDDLAVSDLDAALAITPNDEATIAERGEVYLSLDDYPRAISDLTAALALDPGDSHVLTKRAEAKRKMGDEAGAKADEAAAAKLAS